MDGLPRVNIRSRFIAFFGVGILSILAGVYWLVGLWIRVPGSATLHQIYEQRAKRYGFGVEYKTGPWMILALLIFGVAVIVNLLKGFREAS
jgi:hypothetical protein